MAARQPIRRRRDRRALSPAQNESRVDTPITFTVVGDTVTVTLFGPVLGAVFLYVRAAYSDGGSYQFWSETISGAPGTLVFSMVLPIAPSQWMVSVECTGGVNWTGGSFLAVAGNSV